MRISICIIATVLAFNTTFAQTAVTSQAIINSTTNVIAPEEDDMQNPGGGGGGGFNFRNMMDGETKSTTWIKNDLVKTLLKSDIGRSTILRNNSTKITTTLLEIMGTKQGFYISDSEQVALRDSMRRSRMKNDSTRASQAPPAEPEVEVSYSDETKKIAGYPCKKAYVITTRLLGVKDTVVTWYTSDIKFQYVTSTGGLSGFGNMGSVNGLSKVNGFIMRYEMNMPRGRRMEVEVTKIETGKEIADKEFEIPKDFDIKPMKEMRNMFGGRGGFGMPRQGGQ